MRFSFDYYGDFSKYTKDDLCFSTIEFDTNGKHYLVDLVGEVEYEFSKDHISGVYKCDVEVLKPKKEISDEELKNIFLHMDKSTFRFNILDEGVEPEYRLLEANLFFDKKLISIEKFGKQAMTVQSFFDLLRKYPDWNVDIVVNSQDNRKLLDIADIVADERNGNLIIVTKGGLNEK